MTTSTIRRLGVATLLTLAAGPALAHHPLGGMPMETFAHGALSGVGHPILGFDHLFFILAMGVAAAYTGRAALAAGAYVAAMLAGVLMMSAGIGLPVKEAMIALSLLAVGGIVLSGRALAPGMAAALFAGFGLFHGSAFGDTVATAEAGMGLTVLLGYLIGLGVTQFAIAMAAGAAARRLGASAQAMQPRLAGAVVAGMGLLLTLEQAEGAVFALLGWAA